MNSRPDYATALALLAEAVQKKSPAFDDLASRLRRVENCQFDDKVLRFDLERHPDDWTSVQHYSFDVVTQRLETSDEEIIELNIGPRTLVARDLDAYFDAVGLMDFEGCESIEALENRARDLASGFLPSVVEGWSCPEAVLCSSPEIQAGWEKVSQEAAELYVDAFVRRVVREWARSG